MKIYSFDGKKRCIDNFDMYNSPLYLGQKFLHYGNEESDTEQENDLDSEKPIENQF